ncbi:MAG: hypothetical protein K2I22_05635 [Lachnospiraceae bacterium]|nr:hypothetical protein [Lachnospiraceae bacterium]
MLLFDQDEKICDCCKSEVFPIPEQYLNSEFSIKEELEQQFIDEYIKTSPEFDQYLFDHRKEILAKQSIKFEAALEHGKTILEGRDKGNKFGVECPYCHATNVKKITNTSKAVHTAIFGIFSVSRNSKQWHCNQCNSDF